jgi:hypothetical protein
MGRRIFSKLEVPYLPYLQTRCIPEKDAVKMLETMTIKTQSLTPGTAQAESLIF